MKKCLALVLFLCLLLTGCGKEKELDPKDIDFKNITREDIKKVYIVASHNFYRNPRVMAELMDEEIDELIPLLNKIELKGEASDRFTDIAGVWWDKYVIKLNNGQEFDFAFGGYPYFYVINRQGFDADEEVGRALNSTYFEWDEEYFPLDYEYMSEWIDKK